jgi:cytochrome c biogenesis protein CcdA
VLGHLAWLTVAAGTLAVVMGLLNIKDFARPFQGPGLGISNEHRATLFARIRSVLQQDSTLPALAGTVLLAFAANSYELLCTAGFPMIYTRVLTLVPLSGTEHLLYLLAYNVIYVLPLAAILLLYVRTLGRRRLNEVEGRVLKLVSGLMMLGLGLVLLWRPDALSHPLVALGLTLLAIAVAALAYRVLPARRGRIARG